MAGIFSVICDQWGHWVRWVALESLSCWSGPEAVGMNRAAVRQAAAAEALGF